MPLPEEAQFRVFTSTKHDINVSVNILVVNGHAVTYREFAHAAQHIATGCLSPIFHTEWALPVRTHFVCPERHAQRVEVAQFLTWLRDQVADSVIAVAHPNTQGNGLIGKS